MTQPLPSHGTRDAPQLTPNAVRILEKRYLARDEGGHVVETPSDMFRRVARAVAAAEEQQAPGSSADYEERFYRLTASLDFLPNSPTLMNAGREIGQLAACFVLPVEDSMEAIFDAVKHMALVHQSGGGTGFSFSRLRPRGARVKSTGGVASGPVSFMQVFDQATNVIKQGGRRRGANMAILRVDHPDVAEFVLSKAGNPDILKNFNISVAATDRFMQAVAENGPYELTHRDVGGLDGTAACEGRGASERHAVTRSARDIFNLITAAAWQCGDPGLVFIDEVNRHNPLAPTALIEATNPCGEQPLLPYESCNLGSLNLRNFVVNGSVDDDRLGETVDLAVRFLDDVITVNRLPMAQIREATLATRKIGLGVMGFADVLYLLGVPYDSERALALAEELMGFITDRARRASESLGAERGPFPLFERSTWKDRGWRHLRNATCTTIAPTGTLGLIAGVSSGIEPVFALRYWRRMAEGTMLMEAHPIFEEKARALGLEPDDLFEADAGRGSVQHCSALPEHLRRTFVTARDISPEWHVRMQAAFQKVTDNGVSKTVNLPAEASVSDVARTYLLAHELRCKGITVYREGSRREDLLHAGPTREETGLSPDSVQDVLEDVEDIESRCRCP